MTCSVLGGGVQRGDLVQWRSLRWNENAHAAERASRLTP